VREVDEQVIRSVFERWNSGEREIDPAEIDPEIEVGSMLARRSFHGYDGVREWMLEIDEQFDDWRVFITDVTAAGPDRYVVEGSIHGRGRQSGVDLDQPASWLIETRDGRFVRLINFIGHGGARQALDEER
jgi:ketosteroid isomerase-like protein